MDIDEILSEILNVARQDADVFYLGAVREVLLSPEFDRSLANEVESPDATTRVAADLARVILSAKFSLRDRIADRREQHQVAWSVMIGSGTALAIGAVLAAGTQTPGVAFLAVLPLLLGSYAVWRGSRESRRLALEISMLGDIVELLDVHLAKLVPRRT